MIELTESAKIAAPKYTCPGHGDIDEMVLYADAAAVNLHEVFCFRCFAEKLHEIGVSRATMTRSPSGLFLSEVQNLFVLCYNSCMY